MKKRYYTEYTQNDNIVISWFFKIMILHIFYDWRGEKAGDWKVFVTFKFFGFELFHFHYRDEHRRSVYTENLVFRKGLPTFIMRENSSDEFSQRIII